MEYFIYGYFIINIFIFLVLDKFVRQDHDFLDFLIVLFFGLPMVISTLIFKK